MSNPVSEEAVVLPSRCAVGRLFPGVAFAPLFFGFAVLSVVLNSMQVGFVVLALESPARSVEQGYGA